MIARMSEVRYKLSQVCNPSKVKFPYFDMMKRYVEEIVGQLIFLMIRRRWSKTRRFGQTTVKDSTMIPAQGKKFWENCRKEIG